MAVAAESEGPRQRKSGAGKEGSAKELSVIVPTYNEVENIRPLCERLFKATKAAGLVAEMIIVDDESKGSEETARIAGDLGKEGYEVRIHQRKRSEGRGLSSAVLLGFRLSRHHTLLCMDADLQHEPESVPAVAAPVLEGDAEFSVGSRNVEGGGLGFDWALHRRIISHGATLLAIGVAASSDPMSGFFCTRKDVLARGEGRLNTIGFKIGLEIMARCRANPVKDVAITFQERTAGESKLSTKAQVQYVQQLVSLYTDRYFWQILLLVVLLVVVLYLSAQRLLR